MKKLIIVLGIAVSMYLASESDENQDDASKSKSAEVTYYVSEEELKEMEKYEKKRSAEAQRILDEGYRYGGPLTEENASRQISGDVLVSNLTVSQLRGIVKDVVKSSLRECETTSTYATGTSDRSKWWQETASGLSKHSITCKY